MTRDSQDQAARPAYEPPRLMQLSPARNSAAVCSGPGSGNLARCDAVGTAANDCASGSNTLACNPGTVGNLGCSPSGSAF